MPTILSTEGLPLKEREAFWRQAMSETFVPLTVGEVGEDRFEGSIRANWVGRLMIAEIVIHRSGHPADRASHPPGGR